MLKREQMASANAPKSWFPAKRYGWGWGLPSAWQGWIVLFIYLVLVFGGIPFVQVSDGSFVYALYLVILTVALIAVCWLTGEPPRWRSGGRDA
jgi:hypothetical protein